MPQQWIFGAPGDGVSDHGALTGLADDDHSQYHNNARGDLRYSQLGHNHDLTYAPLSHAHTESDITDLGAYLTQAAADLLYSALGHNHDLAYAAIGHNHDLAYAALSHSHTEADITDLGAYLTEAAADLLYADISHTHGAADHGSLSGLADDDHTQYHTDARGDARYSLLAHNHDAAYYTESEVDTLLTGYSPTAHNHSGVYSVVGHTHTESDISDLGAYLTEAAADLLYADISHTHSAPDHGALGGLTDDDHTQYVLLAGRSGGQTVYGGTASGDDLYVYSTSHATKGDIVLANGGGRVGIGQLPDSAILQVYAGNSGGTPLDADYVPFCIENDTAIYAQFLTPNDAASGIVFSDPDDWDVASVKYNHSTNLMTLTADAVDTMYMTDGYAGFGISPLYPVHAAWTNGGSYPVELHVYGGGLRLQQVGNHATDPTPFFTFQRGRGTTIAGASAVSSGDLLFGFQVGGHDGTAFRSGWNGGIQLVSYATENWDSTHRGADFRILTTAKAATSAATRVTVNETGVGIGTAPTQALTVNGGVTIVGSAGNFVFDATGNVINLTRAGANYITANGTGASFAFQTASTNRFFVGNDGKIGVGTTTPDTRLDIDAGALEIAEMTAPGAGAANTVRIYAEDNGSGKTRLMAIFSSGAAQQIAIQP